MEPPPWPFPICFWSSSSSSFAAASLGAAAAAGAVCGLRVSLFLTATGGLLLPPAGSGGADLPPLESFTTRRLDVFGRGSELKPLRAFEAGSLRPLRRLWLFEMVPLVGVLLASPPAPFLAFCRFVEKVDIGDLMVVGFLRPDIGIADPAVGRIFRTERSDMFL